MESPNSPITKIKSTIIDRIPSKKIIHFYLKKYGIGTHKYFENLFEISIYECPDTGYRFYYPFTVEGKPDLYEQLQKFPWYYMPWKWEHEVVLKFIKSNDQILEIGSGSGGFLKGLFEKKGITGTGLEFNQQALEEGLKQGLNILPVSLSDFSNANVGKFDVVCSFQVLEHLSQVKAFFEDQITCLKSGGYLITAVPNNDSFIKYGFNPLNVPPHHMGLWTDDSLEKVGKYFGLKPIATHFSPLEEHHRNYFYYANLSRFLPDFIARKLPRLIRFLLFDTKVENLLFPHTFQSITILKVWQKI